MYKSETVTDTLLGSIK